jgi:RimJ/RimL family protein N-acetyltransferase
VTADGAVLQTARLRLRPWSTCRDDLARLLDLYGREEVTRWLGGRPSVTPVELVARWAAVSAAGERSGVWAVEVVGTGVVAGTLLLKPLPDGVGEVEVGWHLHPDSWGHGYATEAARLVIDRAFAAGLPEVYAVVRPAHRGVRRRASSALTRATGCGRGSFLAVPRTSWWSTWVASSGVGAVPPRWAGCHQRSSGPAGGCG